MYELLNYIVMHWNLSKPSLLETKVCVPIKWVFGLNRRVTKISYIVILFRILFN